MSWIAVGVGVVGAVGGAISRGKANKKMKALEASAEANKYQANPLAQKRLDLASTLLNARMPGATAAERNIQTAGANTLANVQRNSMSGAQSLALAGAVQGQEGQQISGLQQQELGDYQRRYNNQENAMQGVINEGDKVHGSNQQFLGQQTQLQGAQAANNANTWSSISNLGFGAANFGMNGGFNSGMGRSVWGGGNGGAGGSAGANAWMMNRDNTMPQFLPYRNT